MAPAGVPNDPLFTVFGETVTRFPQDGSDSEELTGIILREVLLMEGDLQYYATVLDIKRTTVVEVGDHILEGSNYWEVSRIFVGNDPNWHRAVLAARRTGA